MSVRLQKYLADAGVASRRAAEKLILEGEVSVNGKTVREMGTKVNPQDKVMVGSLVVRVKKKIYVALNKPRGFICTRSDPEKRKTVGDLLPKEWNNLFTVGRLDNDSEGLIFLTNDGDFCLKLTHPRYGVRKAYAVAVTGRVESSQVAKIAAGVEDCGDLLKVEKVRLVNTNNTHSVLEVELAEGKNREIRRLFFAVGLEVERLVRIRIGPIKLGELPTGKWRTLTEAEIKSLLPRV